MDAGTQAQYTKNAVKTFTSYSNTTGAETKSYSFTNNKTQNTNETKVTTAAGGTTQTDPELLEVVVRAAP